MADSFLHNQFFVLVTGPTKPRFLQYPRDVNVTEGSPVEIPCEASGIPKPDIVWTKDDEPVVEGPRIQVGFHFSL